MKKDLTNIVYTSRIVKLECCKIPHGKMPHDACIPLDSMKNSKQTPQLQLP